MATIEVGFEKLALMRKRVVEVVLDPLRACGHYRLLPKGTSVAFDPSKVWLVERGEISLEHRGRSIMTLEQGDLAGPWMGSVGALSLITTGFECELVGFDHAVVGDALSQDEALKAWCAFLAVSTSYYFAEFAEMRLVSVPPAPRTYSFAPGEVIISEGDAGKDVFLLVDGGAEVTVRGTLVGEIQAGEIFGALAALTQRVRTATVTATKATKCLAFRKDEFRDFLRANTTLMEKIFEDFARALGDVNESVMKANSTKWRNLF